MVSLGLLIALAIIFAVGNWVFWRLESQIEELEAQREAIEEERSRLLKATTSPSRMTVLLERDPDGQCWPVGFQSGSDPEIRH